MTKKYGIRNTSECVLRLTLGKATIVCNFTNGNLQSREPIPASFSTSNPIVQHAIETCDRFKNNLIFVMAEYGEQPQEEEKVEKLVEKTKKTKAKKETRVIDSVRTHGEAVNVLMMEADVQVSDLADIESCIRKAAEVGITFPNLK